MPDELHNPELKKLLKDIGTKLAKDMPENYGFTLLMFGYGDIPDLFYLSTANRTDMLKTMQEFINKCQSEQIS